MKFFFVVALLILASFSLETIEKRVRRRYDVANNFDLGVIGAGEVIKIRVSFPKPSPSLDKCRFVARIGWRRRRRRFRGPPLVTQHTNPILIPSSPTKL